jgi:hypothetical protein
MSTGYKQYLALRNVAIDNGADVSGVDGYALERFIQVCQKIIEAIGGTFTPVTGGTLEQRKANALHQLALANGSAPELSGTTRERQIQSVVSILQDNGIDYSVPRAAQDWRLLVLIKLLQFGPADQDQIIQWLINYDGPIDEWTDKVAVPLASPKSVGVPVLQGDGVSAYGWRTNSKVTAYPFTLTGWFLPNATQNNSNNYLQCIGNLTGANEFLAVAYVSSGALRIIASDGTQNLLTTAETFNDGDWHYYEARFISATLREIWVGDTVGEIELLATDTISTSFASGLNRYSILARDLGTSVSQYFKGEVRDLSVKSSGFIEHAPLQENGASAYSFESDRVLVFLGDSNTADNDHTSIATYKYAEYLTDAMDKTISLYNSGVGGWQTTDILANLTTKLDPFYNVLSVCECTLMVGVNDLALGGKTPAQTVSDYESLIDAIIAKGWSLTCIAYYGWTGRESDLAEINAGVRDYCAGKCNFFDPTPTLNDGGGSLKAEYIDATWPAHLNDLGGEVLGQLLLDSGYIDLKGNTVSASEITLVNPSWSTADGISCWARDKGYTFDSPDYILALHELVNGQRRDARDNLPIGVVGSEDVPLTHNGGPAGMQETDANFAAFSGANLMGNGVDTWNPLYYADYTGFINGTNNVWIQWWVDTIGTAGACIVKERIAYPVTKVLTLAEYNQTLRWAQRYTSSCGGGVVPFDFSFNFSSEDNSANIAAII